MVFAQAISRVGKLLGPTVALIALSACAPFDNVLERTLPIVRPIFEGNKDWQIWRKTPVVSPP
jgi:hypothetical protein